MTLEEVKTLLRHENIATKSQVYGEPEVEMKHEMQNCPQGCCGARL